MPQRTNDFQDLVALVQRTLADQGALVTESALVGDDEREIDILIDTMAGPYRIRIAVEAKDEGRPMDSTKFESIIGKYFGEGGIKVNKVVVVTHRGFYKPVIDRAQLLDVDLFTLTQATQIDWGQFRPPGPCFRSRISIENIAVQPTVTLSARLSERGRVKCSCGRDYGLLNQFAEYLFWTTAVGANSALLASLDDEVATTSATKRARVNLTLPHDHTADLSDGESKVKVDGLTFDIVLSKSDTPNPNFIPHVQFRLAPHICRIEAEPPLPVAITKEFQKNSRLVCTCCGKDHGSLLEWSHDVMFRRVLPSRPELSAQFEQKMKSEPNGHAQLTVHWPLCSRWRIQHGDQKYAADKLLITIHAAVGTGKLECKQYDWTPMDGKSRRISQLEATVAGKRLRLLMPDGLQNCIANRRLARAKEGEQEKAGC